MKVLIIEDEQMLSNTISRYLETQSYLCEQAFDFQDAKLKVGVYQYDCILLDLMLPGGNGLDILREIKRKNNPAGVIIISAKGSLDDKLAGLEIGADDYLPKPFALPELSMRIYALMRRKNYNSNNVVTFGPIVVDLLQRQVTVNGQPVKLTKTEYELLLFFIGNKDKVIAKSTIAEHLSGDMADLFDNFDFVYNHIKNLKAKLARCHCPDFLKTVYGVGYKWVEP